MEKGAVRRQGFFSAPILRPRGLTLLGAAIHLAAAGAVAIALSFQQVSFMGWLSAAVLFGALAGWTVRRSGPFVGGLRAGPYEGYWEVLLPSGWVLARQTGSAGGPGRVSLRLALGQDGAVPVRMITVTLWRRCLPPLHWRRLCVLAARLPAPPVAAAAEAA